MDKWIGLNADKLIQSPPIDCRLGYCTKHGHTTACPYCRIEELEKQNAILREALKWIESHPIDMEITAVAEEALQLAGGGE